MKPLDLDRKNLDARICALARESGLTFVTNSVDIAASLWRGPGATRSIGSVASTTVTTSRPSVR